MNKSTTLTFIKELLWLIIACIITTLVLLPIVSKVSFIYLNFNIIVIFIGVYYARFIVNFRNIPYLQHKWVRVGLIILNVNLFFWIMQHFQDFTSKLDNFSLTDFISGYHVELDLVAQTKLLHYINKEVMISGVACLVLIVLLIFRVVYSFFSNNKKLQQFLNE